MADSPEEEKDLTGDDQDGSSADEKDKLEDDKASEPDATPTKGLADYTVDELLKERPDVSRYAQSIKDKAVAAEQDRGRVSVDKALAKVRTDQEEAELRRIIGESKGSDDYDALGRRAATAFEDRDKAIKDAYSLEQHDKDQAKDFNQTVQDAITSHPEYASLGEIVVGQVLDEVAARGGGIVDFGIALSQKKHQQELGQIREQSKEDMREELEAFRAEQGLTKREDAVKKGEDANASVSGEGSGKVAAQETWEEATDAYNRGDKTWDEYKPIKEAHDLERKRK